MGTQLRFSRKAGQGGNRGKFPFLEGEDITAENIAEKMFLQEDVDHGRELIDTSAGGSADDGGLVCRADFADVCRIGQRRGVFADFITDALSFSLIKQGDEGVQSRQAARKAGIGIHLHQHFPYLVDRHAVLQTFGKSCLQFFHITLCRERRNGDDALLFGIQSRFRR